MATVDQSELHDISGMGKCMVAMVKIFMAMVDQSDLHDVSGMGEYMARIIKLFMPTVDRSSVYGGVKASKRNDHIESR